MQSTGAANGLEYRQIQQSRAADFGVRPAAVQRYLQLFVHHAVFCTVSSQGGTRRSKIGQISQQGRKTAADVQVLVETRWNEVPSRSVSYADAERRPQRQRQAAAEVASSPGVQGLSVARSGRNILAHSFFPNHVCLATFARLTLHFLSISMWSATVCVTRCMYYVPRQN